ncbi:MAG: alpha-xylosidase [Butyrivibrio sp.]|nr:alpha-xylosidase [Butyrivibrio sp.]
MKFWNGCWLNKEGVECFQPQQVYYSNIDKDKVILTCPTYHINHRGDTLGGINLTLEITSPLEGVLRLKTYHHKGALQKEPSFEVYDEKCKLETKETEEEITVTSGSLAIRINKNNFLLSYERDGEVITTSAWKDLALVKTNWKGLAYDKDGVNTYMRQELSLSVGELVYGLGERFGAMVRNGQSIDIWNEDGGTSTDQSYKNIPFYITNKGYGVFVNHPEKVSFEVATEQVGKVEFSVPGEMLDYYLIDGPTMKEVLEKYTTLTGKPSLPPMWTFGLWLSTSFTTNYDEKTVMSFIDGMLERGIPLRVFHFDCFWMKEFHWTDFVWDSRVFPDPKGMLGRIKKKGIKICVWINPYIGQSADIFDEGHEKGYFLKRTDGSTWQWDMWQPGMALVDFTNPEAKKWFKNKLFELMDMGVDCFKTDFGERIPTEDVVYYDGSDPEKMHNYYTYLYNQAVFEAIEEKKGKGEAVLFARSATVGGQKFPVHWGGDCWSTYEGMSESLRGGLSLTMSGFGFWSHDMGGFENTSTPDVYKRWAAFGLLSSHSRLHGSSSYRVPWAYDEEAVDVVRFFAKLKMELLPYLYSNAVETSQSGIPVMRSMVLEYETDPAAGYLERQYMLGSDILVAPVFNDKSIAQYYLPAGRWTNFLTGEKRILKAGAWQKEKQGYLEVPMWVRENSMIAVNDAIPSDKEIAQGNISDDYTKTLEFRVYELTDVAESGVYYDGSEVVEVSALLKDKGNVILTKNGKVAVKVRFVNHKLEADNEKNVSYDGNDTIVLLSEDTASISLR